MQWNAILHPFKKNYTISDSVDERWRRYTRWDKLVTEIQNYFIYILVNFFKLRSRIVLNSDLRERDSNQTSFRIVKWVSSKYLLSYVPIVYNTIMLNIAHLKF